MAEDTIIEIKEEKTEINDEKPEINDEITEIKDDGNESRNEKTEINEEKTEIKEEKIEILDEKTPEKKVLKESIFDKMSYLLFGIASLFSWTAVITQTKVR